MPTRSWRIFVASALASLLLGACASKPRPVAEAPMSPEQRELALKSFDQVWETIRDRHFDATYNGVDWNAVRDEFRPRAEQAQRLSEARAAMQGAIDRLNQSHFGIIASEAYSSLASKKGDAAGSTAGPGSTGIHARVLGDEAYVFRVDPASAAEQAGVKPGWRIDRIDDRKVAELFNAVNAAYAGQVKRDAMAAFALRSALNGKEGERTSLTLHDGRRSRGVNLVQGPPAGRPVTVMALPDYYLTQEARTLPSGVGYIAFSVFMDPRLVVWFGERVREFNGTGAPGLIIDLRGNPGGIGAMAMGMGNWLVSTPDQKLGTMMTRDLTLNFVLNPQAAPFKGPVAVLTDELSASTSEILAGGLQDLGRARVFGTQTPGMALPSVVVELPTGDGFQFAQANYVSADGVALEGFGVTPDEPTPLDPAALRAGRDTTLEAAERWILSQR